MQVYLVGQRGGYDSSWYDNVVLVAATLDIAKEYVDDQIKYEEDNVPAHQRAWHFAYGDWWDKGDEWLRERANSDNDTWYVKEWEVAEG
jgi:hypothetical protein